jgi:hypothetical protein
MLEYRKEPAMVCFDNDRTIICNDIGQQAQNEEDEKYPE